MDGISKGDTVELINPMDSRCGKTAVVIDTCDCWSECLVDGETETDLFFSGEIKKV